MFCRHFSGVALYIISQFYFPHSCTSHDLGSTVYIVHDVLYGILKYILLFFDIKYLIVFSAEAFIFVVAVVVVGFPAIAAKSALRLFVGWMEKHENCFKIFASFSVQ